MAVWPWARTSVHAPVWTVWLAVLDPGPLWTLRIPLVPSRLDHKDTHPDVPPHAPVPQGVAEQGSESEQNAHDRNRDGYFHGLAVSRSPVNDW